ncbi:MAG: hypothetical protein ACREK2_08935 [Gemmatimonadota bacterium]
MSEARDNPEAPALDPESAAGTGREALVAELETAVGLEEGEVLERAYVFETVERGDVSFTLALVLKRLAFDRLEMVAVGGRVDGGQTAAREFVRRARFPESVLSEILAEFIDRCGVEGAQYREVRLAAGDTDTLQPLERLAELLAPAPNGL